MSPVHGQNNGVHGTLPLRERECYAPTNNTLTLIYDAVWQVLKRCLPDLVLVLMLPSNAFVLQWGRRSHSAPKPANVGIDSSTGCRKAGLRGAFLRSGVDGE